MKEEMRRFVAYAAVGRVTGRFGTSVYSYAARRHSGMSRTFDYECRAHLGGAEEGSLYHYGLRAHINLEVDGHEFKGFDYESRSHFSGKVNGRAVQMYDYGERKYYNYTA